MSFIKKLIPGFILKPLRPFYHGLNAIIASWYYGRPSEKLVVIGITGTVGKSTTAAMLAHILNGTATSPNPSLGGGGKTGYITTVNFFDGDQDLINKHGLSMPGGWLLQKQLKAMLNNGCKYAIVECTSEGLAQNRHLGINFDIALFTNLSYAHIEAHGTFGNYKLAKARLFETLAKCGKKSFFPEKMIGVNFDDPMSGYFLGFLSQKRFGVSFRNIAISTVDRVFHAVKHDDGAPAEFEMEGVEFCLNILGKFNSANAALAATCANMLGMDLAQIAKSLSTFRGVPGRMENISNNLGVTIIVDYGCEPESIRSSLESAAQLPRKKLIHVFGSTGGHRDVSKRFVFGKTSAQYADEIIVTNDDVYDSDPERIAGNIVEGIKSFTLREPPYKVVLDRRQAIHQALAEAKKGDVVLITGKGSEQFLVLPANQRIDWDDRKVVREELARLE